MSRTVARMRRSASLSDSPRRTDSVPCERMSWPSAGQEMRLDLGRKHDPPRASRPERRRIHVAEVVHGEYEAAFARHALPPVRLEPPGRPGECPEDALPERPPDEGDERVPQRPVALVAHAALRARTSASIRSST